MAKDELKVIVAFSSTTARLGRKGQVAYAAANEVLNKMALREAQAAGSTKVLWHELGAVGGWDGYAGIAEGFCE